MKIINIGVGEYSASNGQEDILKTYALGSCVGVIMIAPRQKAAGLLHIALPESRINPQIAIYQPGMFSDTGIPALLKKMERLGCSLQDLKIKLVGGANILDHQNHFEIGKKNILATKKVLWRYKLGAIAEDLGQNFSRTVTLEVSTGKIILSSPGKGEWLL